MPYQIIIFENWFKSSCHQNQTKVYVYECTKFKKKNSSHQIKENNRKKKTEKTNPRSPVWF